MGNKFVPIGIIIIAILALVSIKPLTLEVRTTNAKIKAYQSQSMAMQQKIDKLNELQPKIEQYSTEINNLKMAMPAAQQIPEVLVMVESIARNTSLDISGFDIQPSSGTSEVTVNMQAAGSYENLALFTDKLEKNMRPIAIRTMSVTSANGDAQRVSVAVSFAILFQGKEDQQVALPK